MHLDHGQGIEKAHWSNETCFCRTGVLNRKLLTVTVVPRVRGGKYSLVQHSSRPPSNTLQQVATLPYMRNKMDGFTLPQQTNPAGAVPARPRNRSDWSQGPG